MNNIFKGLVFGSCTFSLTEFAPGTPQAKGDRDEVLALVKIALIYHEEHGLAAALLEANRPDCQFSLKDLHVMAVDTDGTVLAHRDSTKVGKNLLKCRDARGIFINKEFIRIGGSAEGKGWVRYRMPDPFTKVPQHWCAYVERLNDVYWVCGYHLH